MSGNELQDTAGDVLTEAFERCPEAMLVVDDSLRVEHANQEAKRLGLAVGMSLPELLGSEQREQVLENLRGGAAESVLSLNGGALQGGAAERWQAAPSAYP
ncbi:MAG: hypothetical protein GXN98_04335 [Euryarchaeota archaeon]|nr:hypothetical protein [Euryarchaeota archaeon]